MIAARAIGWRSAAAWLAALVVASPAAAAAPQAAAARVGPAPSSQRLALVLPLRADLAGLRRLALAVSTPGTPAYGQFKPLSELARRFGASAATRAKVVGYLRRSGATGVRVDATGLFADAEMTAVSAERLFGTSLARFTSGAQRFIAPTGAARIPRVLRDAVTGIVGLDTRPLVSRPAAQRTSGYQPASGTQAGCAQGQLTGGFTPNQYLTAYNFNSLRSAGFSGQGQRVALIEIDGFKSSDVSAFARCFGLGVPPLDSFGVGISQPLAPGPEATLDVEVLDSAAPGLRSIDVYETHANAANILRSLTAPLQNRGHKPQIVSVSLGQCEPFVALAVGTAGLNSSEAALSMATASGVTFLAASGDMGSAACSLPSGQPIPRLAVSYPASSWWVTGVGGTNLFLSAANTITNQLVWNDAAVLPGSAGGGGFSFFNRPPYQRGLFSRNSRAVPDVAMLADVAPGYSVYCSAAECLGAGSAPWRAVGGTSAATPLLAGGFALVDQDLRAHRRQPLGLANSLLYTVGNSSAMRARAFSDVSAYGNDVGPFVQSSGSPLGCCSAHGGFDEASGWGSVDIGNLAQLAVQLQPPYLRLSLRRHQQPVARHGVLATVSCEGACRLAAFADVRIGRAKPFLAKSAVSTLAGAGSRTTLVRFSAKQLRSLRTGLRRHRRIVATVFGVELDRFRLVAAETPGKKLVIRG